MKITSANSQVTNYSKFSVQNNKSNPNFSGAESISDGMVKFWQMVDNGGRAAQFTVEDMFGTNLPRMYQGLMAGKKYTGKYNWKAFIQESIREILTGPTMTFFPMLTLFACKKCFGATVNTKSDNVANFSYLMGNIEEGCSEAEKLRPAFLTECAKDALKRTLDNDDIDDDSIKTLADKMGEYSKKYSQVINSTKETKKAAKAGLKEAQEDLLSTFGHIVKNLEKDYSKTNFKTVKFTLADNVEKADAVSASNYFEYAASYIHDYIKDNSNKDGIVNVTKKAIEKFKNNYRFKRVITIANMILLTGIVMRQIPKLYTRGRVNPNAEEIYNEAENRKNGTKSQSEEITNDK